MKPDVVIDQTIASMPSLAGHRAELKLLSHSLTGQPVEVAIGKYVAGVVKILFDAARAEPEPPPDAKGWWP